MHGLITLVGDNQADNYLKEILVFVYNGLIVNNRPFLYNLYIFVWIQCSCLANKVFCLDPSNLDSSVIKRLWCCCFFCLCFLFYKLKFIQG